MSNKKAKLARKEFLRVHEKVITSALQHFRMWYKGLSWGRRLKLCWKIMRRTF